MPGYGETPACAGPSAFLGSAEEGDNTLQRYRNYINKFDQINIFQRVNAKKAVFLICQRVKITIT